MKQVTNQGSDKMESETETEKTVNLKLKKIVKLNHGSLAIMLSIIRNHGLMNSAEIHIITPARCYTGSRYSVGHHMATASVVCVWLNISVNT